MKRVKAGRASVLALLFAVVPVLAVRGQGAPEPAAKKLDKKADTKKSDAKKTFDEEVGAVARTVATLRERAFMKHVPARTMRCGVAAVRLMEIARAEGARCSPDIELAVRALGFCDDGSAPSGSELRPAFSNDEAGPCGLAFYDQLEKEIVVVEGRSAPDERGEVLAHELSHALQDQLFDLRARLRILPRTPSGDHDAEELAANAAINEGEATVLELLYVWNAGGDRSTIQGVFLDDPLETGAALLGAPLDAARTRTRRLERGMKAILDGTKKAWQLQRRLGAGNYLQTLARFQYLAGAHFVADAYRRGGWAGVDELRTSPPSSTEQLLHPEKYFDEVDAPVLLEPSPFATETPGRFRLLYDNRLGELGASLVTESEAKGWGGDRYRVLERKNGSCVVESRSVWDDEESAKRFFAATPRWIRTMKLRESCWDVIERRGRAVVVVAGLEKDEVADAVQSAFKDGPEGRFAEHATGDRTIALRKRAADGTTAGEARVVEWSAAKTIMAEHLDASREGSIETDGSSYGVRARRGGGVTMVLVSAEGSIFLAGASDRAVATDVIGTLERMTSDAAKKTGKTRATGKIDIR